MWLSAGVGVLPVGILLLWRKEPACRHMCNKMDEEIFQIQCVVAYKATQKNKYFRSEAVVGSTSSVARGKDRAAPFPLP